MPKFSDEIPGNLKSNGLKRRGIAPSTTPLVCLYERPGRRGLMQGQKKARRKMYTDAEKEFIAKEQFVDVLVAEGHERGTAELMKRLIDPNQPSIEEEMRFIKLLESSESPEEWTVEDERKWNGMVADALAYNRLRRALRYRNNVNPEMTFAQFEELAQTGSCLELGVVGD